MSTTTAEELTKFLLAEYPDGGAAWVMKVVYYAQGWTLAWEGEPMFDENVEAWDLGPVVPEAYIAFYQYRSVGTAAVAPAWSLPPKFEAIARAVADFYRKFSGSALIDATHKESPWTSAYGTRPSFNTRGSNPIIERSEMMTYFSQRAALADEHPSRPVTAASTDTWGVDRSTLAAATRSTSRRWAGALELLAK